MRLKIRNFGTDDLDMIYRIANNPTLKNENIDTRLMSLFVNNYEDLV